MRSDHLSKHMKIHFKEKTSPRKSIDEPGISSSTQEATSTSPIPISMEQVAQGEDIPQTVEGAAPMDTSNPSDIVAQPNGVEELQETVEESVEEQPAVEEVQGILSQLESRPEIVEVVLQTAQAVQ